MRDVSNQLRFLVNLAHIEAIIVRELDRSIGGGLGFNDFYPLSPKPGTY